jgi:hypothetical protein
LTEQSNEWLEEPAMPKPEDFKNHENYEFAFNEYKQKLTTYQARIRLHNDCKKYTEDEIKEKAEQEEELLKSPFFRLMVECDEKGEPKQRRQFPDYEFFTPYNEEEQKLGYGKSAVRDPFKTAKSQSG